MFYKNIDECSSVIIFSKQINKKKNIYLLKVNNTKNMIIY